MELVRCAYGHYYDPSRYTYCPHCEMYGQGDEDPGFTVAKDAPQAAPVPPPAEPIYASAPVMEPDESVTVALAQESMGFDPIAGWLVCVHGTARGEQYLIRTERNSLGRGSKMDICIKGDLGISRENHATISYNPRARTFTLIPGEGKSIIYLNGQEVLSPTQLTVYDRIEISATVLVFVPLCSEVFSWEDEANQ